MKKYFFSVAALLVIAGVIVSPSLPVFAADDEPTTDQTSSIRANCLTIKNTLNQLHASDALLRVNRGQLYESLVTKLMDRFNTRLSINGIDAPELVLTTTSYQAALTTFRVDYQQYEQALSAALRIDCLEDPTAFYKSVQSTRNKRVKVHDGVNKLHGLITNYQTDVNDFAASYKRASEVVR